MSDNLCLVCIATNKTRHQVPMEEVYMSTISNERGQEICAEAEVEEVLVEVGKVSETQGGIFGLMPDIGNGLRNG